MTHFGCCRTKTIPSYFICENCLKVFHKACVLRQKNNFKFKKDYIIICCEKPRKMEEEISLLEQTIEELTDEAQAKNIYIEKQKTERNLIMQEALQTEKELNELISKQEKMIQELQIHTKELEELINSMKKKPDSTTIGVQTNRVKISSQNTQTTKPLNENNTVHTQTEINEEIIDRITMENKKEKHTAKRKILIIGDETAKNISTVLNKQTYNFTLEGIVMPNVDFSILSRLISNYTSNYGENDFVICLFNTSNISNHLSLNNALRSLLSLGRITNILMLSRRTHFGDDRIENYINQKIRKFSIKYRNNVSIKFTPNIKNFKHKIDVVKNYISAVLNVKNRRIVLKSIQIEQTNNRYNEITDSPEFFRPQLSITNE